MKKMILVLSCFCLCQINGQNWAPFPYNQITTWVDEEGYVDYFFADYTLNNFDGDSLILLNYTFNAGNLQYCVVNFGGVNGIDGELINWHSSTRVEEGQYYFRGGGNELLLKPFALENETYFTNYIHQGDSLFLTASAVEYYENDFLQDSVKYFFPTYKLEEGDSVSNSPMFILGKTIGFIQMVNPFYLMVGRHELNVMHGYQKKGDYQRGFIGSAYDFSFQPQCVGDTKISKTDYNVYYLNCVIDVEETDSSLQYTTVRQTLANPYPGYFDAPDTSVVYHSLYGEPDYFFRRNRKLFLVPPASDVLGFTYAYQTMRLDSNNRVFVSRSNLDGYVGVLGEEECEFFYDYFEPNTENYKHLQGLGRVYHYPSIDWGNEDFPEPTVLHGYKICNEVWGDYECNIDVAAEPILLQSHQVSPNPVKNLLNIDLGSFTKNGVIKIYDAKGALLLQQSFDVKVDVSFFKNGMYFININDNDKLYFARFLKMD